MKIKSIRLRLTLWNIGVLALVLFAFLFIVHTFVRSYLLSSMDNRLKAFTERSITIVTHLESNPKVLRRYGNRNIRFGNRHREQVIRFFDLNGKLLTLSGQEATQQEPLWDADAFKQAKSGKALFSIVTDSDEPFRVYSCPFMQKGRQVGVVQTAVSYEELQILLQNLTVTLIILVPVALIIAGLVGMYLTNRALKPVRRIVDAAGSLNTDDLSLRLPVVGADEFAHLANTINSLLAKLDGTFTKLKEAIERERRFTADASHELRTPLTAIKANTTLTLRGNRTPEQYREALQTINLSADVINRLVQDLLLLASSDSGQIILSSKAVDPHVLFDKAIKLAQRSDEPQAKVLTRIEDSIVQIWGDPDLLLRLVINLLENALRHTHSDGEVILKAKEKDDRTILTVTDTGEGIAQEHLPHLFERFYRIDAARSREHGGTGLGLSICKSIVEAHGGSITIDSTLGQGIRVTVLLPTKKPS